jgi:hypothetical protein
MKIKLIKDKHLKKGKIYYSYRITIPKLLMEQGNWDKVKELNISIGFQSNDKPYLMLNELPKKNETENKN